MLSHNRIEPLDNVVPPLVHRHVTPTHSASDVASSHPTPSKHLHLTRWQYTLVWITYVLISLLNAILTLLFAAIYYGAYNIRGGYMIESVGLLSLENIPVVIVCYGLTSLTFFRLAFRAIVTSIRARRLVFVPQPKAHTTKPHSWIRRMFQSITIRIEFEILFLFREIIEVATQSYQVYKCSTLISMFWINDFYVAMLAINCWISPIIHVRLHHNRPLQQFLYISSDIVLDFTSTFVVPVTIITTIVLKAFTDNLASVSGDMEYAFDAPMRDVPFNNMVKAVQQVFVVTWLDVFTKLLPFISMATCLAQIPQFVQPRPSIPDAISQQTTKKITINPHLKMLKMDQHQLTTNKMRSRPGPLWGRRKLHCGAFVFGIHALFALWGVCIVGFHVQSERVATSTRGSASEGCKMSSQPWFVDKFSCTVLEINCHRRRFTGDADEVALALDTVNADGIGALYLTHCPRLHMPAQLQTLRNLLWLEIYNATLVEWDQDAALTNTKLPALQYLNFIRVNMTTLPVGVQSSDFPHRLRDVAISVSNLTTFPDDLHTKWKRMVNLAIERTLITTIPSTIAQMNPARLSLFDNHLTTIANDFFTPSSHFWILSIAKNPITVWPETVGSLDRIYLVVMDYTAIATLPRWLVDEGAKRASMHGEILTVSAGGSPFCVHHGNETYAGLEIVCREKHDMEIEAYMLSFYDADRQP